MANDSTAQLQALVNRMNAGETGAREELIARAYDRLSRLTCKIFQDFRRVKRFEDSGDILHNAALRLLRRLQAVRVESVADFFYLAAHEIRLALMDVARHYYGPAGPGTHERDVENSRTDGDDVLTTARHPSSHEPSHLTFWTEFHDRAESLPVMERCIFDLLWYHGMTQEEAAQVLNVSLATVKRHWLTARAMLQQFFSGTKFLV
jgi:RNA polymerase sigma factor (sigma-70 family)